MLDIFLFILCYIALFALYTLIRIPYMLVVIIPAIFLLKGCKSHRNPARYLSLTISSLIIAFLLSVAILMFYAYLDYTPTESYKTFREYFFNPFSPDIYYCFPLMAFYFFAIIYVLFLFGAMKTIRTVYFLQRGFCFIILFVTIIATIKKGDRYIGSFFWDGPVGDSHLVIPVNTVVFIIQWIILTWAPTKIIVAKLKGKNV